MIYLSDENSKSFQLAKNVRMGEKTWNSLNNENRNLSADSFRCSEFFHTHCTKTILWFFVSLLFLLVDIERRFFTPLSQHTLNFLMKNFLLANLWTIREARCELFLSNSFQLIQFVLLTMQKLQMEENLARRKMNKLIFFGWEKPFDFFFLAFRISIEKRFDEEKLSPSHSSRLLFPEQWHRFITSSVYLFCSQRDLFPINFLRSQNSFAAHSWLFIYAEPLQQLFFADWKALQTIRNLFFNKFIYLFKLRKSNNELKTFASTALFGFRIQAKPEKIAN